MRVSFIISVNIFFSLGKRNRRTAIIRWADISVRSKDPVTRSKIKHTGVQDIRAVTAEVKSQQRSTWMGSQWRKLKRRNKKKYHLGPTLRWQDYIYEVHTLYFCYNIRYLISDRCHTKTLSINEMYVRHGDKINSHHGNTSGVSIWIRLQTTKKHGKFFGINIL